MTGEAHAGQFAALAAALETADAPRSASAHAARSARTHPARSARADAARSASANAAPPAGAARRGPVRSLASLAGIALALRALESLSGRSIAPAALQFPPGSKPHLSGGPDFSVSHAGPWVAAVATTRGCIGLDIETAAADRLTLQHVCDEVELGAVQSEGAAAMWVAKEAALKAWGRGVREAPEVRVRRATASLGGLTVQLRRVEGLDGAQVCIASSEPLAALEIRPLALDSLVLGLDALRADPRQCAPQRRARDPRTA